MATADPTRDLARAVTQGDLRFIGIYGFALIVPGVDGGSASRIAALKGVNAVAGTSDVINGQKQQHLQSLAFQYARRYNSLLIDSLRRSHDPDVSRVESEIEAELSRMEHGSATADARLAAQRKDTRLLTIMQANGNCDTPGLTSAQSGEQSIRILVFSRDFATEEQRGRMQKLRVEYIIPYNRVVYRSVPRRRFG